LQSAQEALAAASRAFTETLNEGDETKIAIARGRVAGARYAVSAAEMNLALAEAGVVDPEPPEGQ
jgi:hypothetical protein